ncbi:Uroporphyrinogen III synthase HEM4 [[Clostridium] ultunense Esp]|uniref:uroporphyrinogen-III synthase n=1 Tax=Thermicanus aegyptius TaxID=94009 RepID=UPI0002B704BD|nr:uroporphyrinogen-III synthase [Thermicanus aegyptius]CCQ92247.1 Uroporphyrinogen III synthase HEM4 [[Clostridium] ultunense Esp]
MKGLKLVITRSAEEAGSFSEKVRELGGIPIAIPMIRILPAQDEHAIRDALSRLEQFAWLLFTSANGVNYFFHFMDKFAIPHQAIRAAIVTVGPKTSKALAKRGFASVIEAREFRQEGIIEALEGKVKEGDFLLFPRGDLARDQAIRALREWGVHVEDPIVYRNLPNEEGAEELLSLLRRGEIDLITFTSPSTFKNLHAILANKGEEHLLHGTRFACIGPVTAEAVRSCGFPVEIVAEEYTVDGLILAIQKWAEDRKN